MTEGEGHPDWEAAIKAAQVRPPALDSPALQDQDARRAELVAKMSAAHHREE